MKIFNKKSMTIPEILIVLILSAVVISAVFPMWYFTYKTWALERIRTKLRVNLEIGMERIKDDIRLSSATLMSYYPQGEVSYTAISFPKAEQDANGFFTVDADRKIIWDETLIYHVYTDPDTNKTELRKTVFDPRDNSLTSAQRYTQLSLVVQNGDASDPLTPNGENATTTTIFENVVELSISPSFQEFDGYSPDLKRSDNFEFGSVRLEPGYHDIKFEVTGKNASSSGYKMGVDALSISPSGCLREGEYYIPPYASSGDNVTKVYQYGWSGNNYLEYDSDGVSDYITLRDYYDLYRESNFDDSIRENTLLTGNDLYIKLPDLEEGKLISWTSEIEAGSDNGDAVKADYNDAGSVPIQFADVTVRNLVSGANLDSSGDAFRVQFYSHSTNAMTITEAYLDEKDPAIENGCINPPTSATRIKLYFTDALGNISQGVTIPLNSSVYSNWAIFPIDTSKDYFVTYHVSTGYGSYWAGTESTHKNSYLIDGNHVTDASWPAPTSHRSQPLPTTDESISSPDIYVQASLEVWSKSGTVTSRIYDTKLSDPAYNEIKWNYYKPTGSDISTDARSSDDQYMAGASSWGSGSSSNPHALVIGSGRYVQFQAALSATPYWTCIDHSSINVSDASYKSGSITCPTCGKFLIPAVNCPWIDDVTIDWPGSSHICDIAGYMTQGPDFGILKVTVDGNDLIKGLRFNIQLYENFQGTQYEDALTAETEPRNTGR